ncbi:MAG: hypothetical protein WAK11_07045 [Candidatus Cybelea sp.]
MQILTWTRCALAIACALESFSGCSGSASSPASPPMNPHALGTAPFVSPQADLKNGIYVAEYYGSTIVAYKTRNTHNAPPACTVPFTASYVNDVAADDAGNLIDPDGGTHSIIVGHGPDLCGPMAATIADPYGQPADASSLDALHGRIAVANIFDNDSMPGSISVCSVAKGCTSNLTNRAMYEVVAVAMDKKGDCWASAIAAYPSFTPALVYFKKCAGDGITATNYHNSFYGGLDFDSDGNLVSLDLTFNTKGRVFVYSGCDPACKIVGGPFALYDEAVYGHLNKNSTLFATGDFQLGQVDIYNYAPTKITYRYSFNSGLMYNLYPQGVTYSKRAQ